jgi:PTS system nitrogen regulatory IIA component
LPELEGLTRPELIFSDLAGLDAPSILRAMAVRMETTGVVKDAETLYNKLWEREQLGSTGIGGGVAIPHCKLEGLDRVLVAVGVAPGGVDFAAVDDQPVKLFFLVVSPAQHPAAHLKSLAAISKWVKADRHVDRILDSRDPQEIYRVIEDGDA